MSYQSDFSPILTTFKTELTTAFPGIMIEDDNAEIKNKDSLDSWVRISMREGPTDQVTIAPVGSREWQTIGTVIIQIFARTGKGSGVTREISSVVRDIFRGRKIGNSTFRGVSISYQNAGSVWFQQNLIASFFSRDLK